MALCGCLALAVVVLGYRQLQRARQRSAAAAAANEKNALDVGLELLIKDISRHTEAPRARSTAAPRTRTAHGTPTDVASTRLREVAIPPALANLFDEDDDDAPTTHAEN